MKSVSNINYVGFGKVLANNVRPKDFTLLEVAERVRPFGNIGLYRKSRPNVPSSNE